MRWSKIGWESASKDDISIPLKKDAVDEGKNKKKDENKMNE